MIVPQPSSTVTAELVVPENTPLLDLLDLEGGALMYLVSMMGVRLL